MAAASPGIGHTANDANQCGDNLINLDGEQCDGTDDQACPGLCHPKGHPDECGCPSHYQCYETKRDRFTTRRVTIFDVFGSNTVQIGRMKRFCNPADKNDEDPEAVFERDRLISYAIRSRGTRFSKRTASKAPG